MKAHPVVVFALGALAYYGFLRMRGVVEGAPWAPLPAGARRG